MKEKRALLSIWAVAGQVGFAIAVPIVGLTLLGIYADRMFSTTPLFIIIGIIVSIPVAILVVRNLIRRSLS